MSKLILMRHGQTDLNAQGVIFGNLDPDLNPLGINQCNNSIEIIKQYEYDIIYSSPMIRTFNSAKIVNHLNIPIITDERIKEIHFGKFEGLFWEEVKEKYPTEFEESLLDWQNYQYEGGESIAMMQERVINFMEDIDLSRNNFIIAHWGSINALLSHLFSKSLDTYRNFAIENAGVVVMDTSEGKFVLEKFI